MTDSKWPNLLANPLELSVMLRSSPPPLDHVLPGLLAKTVGLMVGPGAVSKTMLSLQLGITGIAAQAHLPFDRRAHDGLRQTLNRAHWPSSKHRR